MAWGRRGLKGALMNIGEISGLYKETGRRTAKDTGARTEALKRATKRVSLKKMAARSEKEPTPKGVGAQWAPTSQDDIEDMISGKKRK